MKKTYQNTIVLTLFIALTSSTSSQAFLGEEVETVGNDNQKTTLPKSMKQQTGSSEQITQNGKQDILEENRQFSLGAKEASKIYRARVKRAIGSEFIIANATHHLTGPAVAGLSNGDAFVVWYDGISLGSNIHGKIFLSDGTALGNDFIINENNVTSYGPSITTLNNGNVLVVWWGGSSSTPGGIYGRVLFPNGTALNDQFQINQASIQQQPNPAVVGLQNGNAFVTWYGNSTYISARILHPDGTPATLEFPLQSGTAAIPNIALSVLNDGFGSVFATWVAPLSDSNFTDTIYAAIVAQSGALSFGPYQINQQTSLSDEHPSSASLNNGNVFVTWSSYYQTPSGQNYYPPNGGIFSRTGTALTNQFQISQSTTSDLAPSVTSLTNGNVFVVWQAIQNGTLLGIYGRELFPNGTSATNEFKINQNIEGISTCTPSAASLTNGDVFVVWQGYNGIGYSDICGRILSTIPLTEAPTVAPTRTPTIAPTRTPTRAPTGTATTPTTTTSAPTSSASRPTPLLLMPAKAVMGGGKILWNFATTRTWKSLDAIEDAEREEEPSFSRPKEASQRVFDYVTSWFSKKSWGEYFDSMEKSVLDYSTSVVKETPSYHNVYFKDPALKGYVPLMNNISYNYSAGMGYLPYSAISGAIGQ